MVEYYLLVVGIMITSLSLLFWSVKNKIKQQHTPVKSNRVN